MILQHKMPKYYYLTLLLSFILCISAFAQSTDLLRHKIQQILADKEAIAGISIIGNEGKDTVSWHGDRQFPLQSVFKFHIALAVLAEVDRGNFSHKQKIEIQKKDLLPGLWSPLREKNPEGGSFTIAKLIEYSVSLSDNVACDALLRLIGGPAKVEGYFKAKGILDLSIKINEEVMQSDWNLMFQNWTTPHAASVVLEKFYDRNNMLLSNKSYAFIWKTMKNTQTGQNRLKGLLPKRTVVAHKTGSSGTNEDGITEAVNDIGIVILPNGKYFIISVFVSHSKENTETNERIIADISKAAWDYFSSKP